MFVARSCAHFQNFGVCDKMSAKSAIEKLQKIARRKEAKRSEHKQKQEEEVELLKKTQVEKELRITQREGALNIQQLVVRSPPHSSSL